MKRLPSPIQNLLVLLGIGAAAGLITVAVFYVRIVGDVHVPTPVPSNNLDAHEAAKKLEIFRQAQKNDRPGYVKLSEVEVNSHLLMIYVKNHPLSDSPIDLNRCRLALENDNTIRLVLWVRTQWLGKERTLVWTRRYQMRESDTGRRFDLVGMDVGKVSLPEPLWPEFELRFGAADDRFESLLDWLQGLPRIDLLQAPKGGQDAIKLYTFDPEESASPYSG